MNTHNLVVGLKIFAVGFPGVFLNLTAIALLLSLMGWAVRRLERSGETSNKAQGDTTKK